MNLTTQVGICNLALARLGEKADLTTITAGGDKTDDMISATYDLERELLLRQFPWHFAQKQAELDYVVASISGATQADPVVVTVGDISSFSDKDIVEISHVDGMTDLNDEYFMIDNINSGANTCELYDDDESEQDDVSGSETINTHESIDGTAYGAYSADGQMRLVGKMGYEYVYSLPSDCIAVTSVGTYGQVVNNPFEVRLDRLYTNIADAFIEYSYQITDDSTPIFHASFINVFAWRLAYVWAFNYTKDLKLSDYLRQQYELALSAAMTTDAIENNRDYGYSDSWLQVRK